MRAKEFILEDVDPSAQFKQIISTLEIECAPYLKEIGGVVNALRHYPLYRGLPANVVTVNTPCREITVNQTRAPMDTPVAVHRLIDSWFLHNKGANFRSKSIFATGDRNAAMGYGQPAIVIPIEEYEYCWSPSYRDLYDQLTKDARINGKAANSINQNIITLMSNPQHLDKLLMDGEYRVNRDIMSAIESNNEIMISCQAAYVISDQWIRDMIRGGILGI